jgi:type IV pilus assembly protein PilB
LVFSTLHTNDAPSAITRLGDIGVPPFLIASSVIAIMAQRLVRINCPKCRESYTPQATEIRAAGMTQDQVAKANFMKGRGCNHCRQTGYRGRHGIFEMMRMTSVIRELTFAQAPTQELRRKARAGGGMRTLLDDGVLKILKGTTTFDEVLSTCHAEVLIAQEG